MVKTTKKTAVYYIYNDTIEKRISDWSHYFVITFLVSLFISICFIIKLDIKEIIKNQYTMLKFVVFTIYLIPFVIVMISCIFLVIIYIKYHKQNINRYLIIQVDKLV
ncbi:hypothetical protein [White-tailed deer poxvirus]|nr:hypothetical protein [White-tailed deer poxvirus]